eukprot:s5585_g4.t4
MRGPRNAGVSGSKNKPLRLHGHRRVWMGYGDLAWDRGPRRLPVRPLRRCTWHWDRLSSWARPASLEELRRCIARKTSAVRRQVLRRSPRYRLRQQRWTPLLVAVNPRKDKLQRAPAVLALSSRNANGTAALANFRRSLIGEGWSELARAFVQGPETLAGSHLGRHRRSWTLLVRGGGPLSEMRDGAVDVHCQFGESWFRLHSTQWGSREILEGWRCPLCCVSISPALISPQIIDKKDLHCELKTQAGNEGCPARLRRRWACEASDDMAKDWLGFDWLGFKEDLRNALVEDVDAGTGLSRILAGRDRLCAEAQAGACKMQPPTARSCWGHDFRSLVAGHVQEGHPFCLLGCVCMQLMMLMFVRQPLKGTWKWEEAFRCPPESFDDYLTHEVPCFVQPTPGHNWSPSDTLSHALRVLLPALRWMDLLDSGWPFFRLVARISAQVCEQNLGRCPATCDTEDMKVLAETLEEKMFEGPREQGPRDRSDLLEAARAVWRSDAKEVQASLGRCGEVALAEAAAVRAATYAHTESLQDVLTGVQLTELVVGDLARRTPCALTELSRSPDFWKSMGFVETWLGGHVRYKHRPACKLHFCPDGSPSMRSCRCEASSAPLSAKPADPRSVCLITGDPGDDRPLESDLSLLVGTHREAPNFWSLTYHLNRLYALRHGYRFSRVEVSNDEMERMRADGALPERKVQWLIVRLISTRLQDRSCELVAWLDSDAFIVSSEPLEELLKSQGFPANHSRPPFFFFASTSATKEIGKLSIQRINISDHFMVVRNSPVSRKMMQEWWRLPLQHTDLSRFRSELFLEQTVMNEYFPRHPKLMAKVPSIELFEGFGGLFVRHMGGIKDMLYRITLRDALVARVLSPLTAPGSGWAQALQQDPVARQLLQLAVDAGWCPQLLTVRTMAAVPWQKSFLRGTAGLTAVGIFVIFIGVAVTYSQPAGQFRRACQARELRRWSVTSPPLVTRVAPPLLARCFQGGGSLQLLPTDGGGLQLSLRFFLQPGPAPADADGAAGPGVSRKALLGHRHVSQCQLRLRVKGESKVPGGKSQKRFLELPARALPKALHLSHNPTLKRPGFEDVQGYVALCKISFTTALAVDGEVTPEGPEEALIAGLLGWMGLRYELQADLAEASLRELVTGPELLEASLRVGTEHRWSCWSAWSPPQALQVPLPRPPRRSGRFRSGAAVAMAMLAAEREGDLRRSDWANLAASIVMLPLWGSISLALMIANPPSSKAPKPPSQLEATSEPKTGPDTNNPSQFTAVNARIDAVSQQLVDVKTDVQA